MTLGDICSGYSTPSLGQAVVARFVRAVESPLHFDRSAVVELLWAERKPRSGSDGRRILGESLTDSCVRPCFNRGHPGFLSYDVVEAKYSYEAGICCS